MTIKFTLYGNNQANLIAQINQLDPTVKYACNIAEYKSKRSLEQNKWARKFAAEFANHTGDTPDRAYDILMFKCNPVFITDPQTNAEIRLPGHFSGLNTAEAAEVQERMISFGIEVRFYWEDV